MRETIEYWLDREVSCECGQTHRVPLQQVTIERGALSGSGISTYFVQRHFRSVLLVADRRTYAAAGERLVSLLAAGGIACAAVVLEDDANGEVIADERSIVRVMLDLTPETDALLAVGSGTIHDIVRFVSHRCAREFISVPTAPSVDGFSSIGAPLIVGGFKQTIPAASPSAIFADLDVLMRAPQPMIAAGFGDMLGKFTSLADWELGRLLLDEPYCPLAAQITRQAVAHCIDHRSGIAQASESGVRALMEGLILSGFTMLLTGNSRPASGGEHHLSHFWEMRLLQQGRKAILHGAKVGAATIITAGLYADAARLTQGEASVRAAAAALPDSAADVRLIREAYGANAEAVLRENGLAAEAAHDGGAGIASRMEVEAAHDGGAGAASRTAEDAGLKEAALRGRIVREWDGITAIARDVPPPAQLAEWLREAGGPSTPDELGLAPELVRESLTAAPFVRNRFTVMRLFRLI